MPQHRTHPNLSPENLRAWREAQHLTRSELAELIGYTDRMIGHWERGTRTPAYCVALALNWIAHTRAPKTF